MFKSSSVTFVFQYFFPVFMIVGMGFGIFMSWNEGNEESLGFAKGLFVISLWLLFFLIQMPFRLKRIETTEKGILIKDMGKVTEVEYKDMEWVTRFDISSPWFITLKYHDIHTGEYKKIAYLPKQKYQSAIKMDAMTEYIKSKISTENVRYTDQNAPSQIKNLIFITLLGLPFALVALYYITESMNLF